jgi:hypothetical protein
VGVIEQHRPEIIADKVNSPLAKNPKVARQGKPTHIARQAHRISLHGTSKSTGSFSFGETLEEANMPVILVPILWVGGAAFLLGGGYYVVAHVIH